MTTVAAQVKGDFDEIWASYSHGRLEDSVSQKKIIRAAHKYASCMSMLARQAQSFPSHKRIFLQESASDAVHLIHVILCGDARAAVFYLRSIIENFWRHQYFSHHEVEFHWLHSRENYHLTVLALREHCRYLPWFSGALAESVTALEAAYSELSREVHSTSALTIVMRETLASITLEKARSKKLEKHINQVLKDVIVLSIASSRDLFEDLHVNVQSFLLSCLDADRKRRRQACL